LLSVSLAHGVGAWGVTQRGERRSRAYRCSRGHRPIGSDSEVRDRHAALPQPHPSGVDERSTPIRLPRVCRLQRPFSLPICFVLASITARKARGRSGAGARTLRTRAVERLDAGGHRLQRPDWNRPPAASSPVRSEGDPGLGGEQAVLFCHALAKALRTRHLQPRRSNSRGSSATAGGHGTRIPSCQLCPASERRASLPAEEATPTLQTPSDATCRCGLRGVAGIYDPRRQFSRRCWLVGVG
jgi:hypothetical protein